MLIPGAAAADGAEQELAEKYAPIVGLKQHEPCASTGEPYRPVPVETVLGQSDVVLLGPDGTVVKNAPTAADLYGKDGDYWLDFPGDPLHAGCGYEQWFDRIAAGKATTAYAHVVGEQGKLALQYWFYYPFNEWNNKHESDWEMIQLVFEAATAEEALDLTPALVGYSQHEGAESATWDDDKLEKRDGHPVVYPGAGSHANQFVQALYLGHSAQTGFGCDDTRGPTRYEQTHVVLLPSEATGADDPFAWLGYLGHWGQQVSGPNSGPTGPTFKGQWAEPITWADEEWRSDNVQVPASSSVAPTATGFFCTTVAKGSEIYIRFLRNPFVVLGLLAAIAMIGVWLSRQTSWSPALPAPIRQRRDVGEIYRSGFRVYRSRWPLFVGIGLHGDPARSACGDRPEPPLRRDRPVRGHRRGGRGSRRRRGRRRALRRVHDSDRRNARVCGVCRSARPDRRRCAAQRTRRLPWHRPGAVAAGLGDAPHDWSLRACWS